MAWPRQKHARDQRRKRHQRDERAFLFTPEGRLLGEMERRAWEVALAAWGGEMWSRRPRHVVSSIYPGARKPSGAGRQTPHGAPTAAGSNNASAPEGVVPMSLRDICIPYAYSHLRHHLK
jgi:hypothetical protein